MHSPDPHDETRVIPAEKLDALAFAAQLKAIRENQLFGLPMVYGRDGKVIHVDPFDAEADLLRRHPEFDESSRVPIQTMSN